MRQPPPTRFKKGNQVYRLDEFKKDGDLAETRYWICCIDEEDGEIIFRLKLSADGEPGEWVEEGQLEFMADQI